MGGCKWVLCGQGRGPAAAAGGWGLAKPQPRPSGPRPLPLTTTAQAAEMGDDHWDFYACTLSSRTIVYKGMLNSNAVGAFYKARKERRGEPRVSHRSKHGGAACRRPAPPPRLCPSCHPAPRPPSPPPLVRPTGPQGPSLHHALCHLPPPLLHQHQPQVAAGAAHARAGAQRRDQHAAGQPQLGGVPPGGPAQRRVGRARGRPAAAVLGQG